MKLFMKKGMCKCGGVWAPKTYRVSILSPVPSAAFQTLKTLGGKREKSILVIFHQFKHVTSLGISGKSLPPTWLCGCESEETWMTSGASFCPCSQFGILLQRWPSHSPPSFPHQRLMLEPLCSSARDFRASPIHGGFAQRIAVATKSLSARKFWHFQRDHLIFCCLWELKKEYALLSAMLLIFKWWSSLCGLWLICGKNFIWSLLSLPSNKGLAVCYWGVVLLEQNSSTEQCNKRGIVPIKTSQLSKKSGEEIN